MGFKMGSLHSKRLDYLTHLVPRVLGNPQWMDMASRLISIVKMLCKERMQTSDF